MGDSSTRERQTEERLANLRERAKESERASARSSERVRLSRHTEKQKKQVGKVFHS